NFNIDFKKVVGFASVTADGFTGPTTGGDAVISGRTNAIVYINGPSEFGKLCEILQQRIRYKTYSNNPLTIVLEAGTYTGAGGKESVWGNSMLTIQEQENLTIIGRKNVIFNFGINVKRSSNLIIRNITFQDYYDDGINIGETETHHVWVDHCTVGHPTTKPVDSEHPDGGIDVKNGASYVTISWTVYRNSWKTGLVGHSDSNGGTDNGRLKVTYFGNHFVNTNSRNPRVRFGEVHVLNNLEERVGLYGIAASNNSSVYAEGNFFLNTRWPMYADRLSADFKAVYGNNSDDAFTSKTGNRPATGLKQINNDYDDSGLPVITSQILPAMLNPGGRSIKFDEFNPQNVFTPTNYYAYTALPASVVKVVVPMYAGADKIDWFPQTLPLDLISFEAKKAGTNNNPQVYVTWKTTNEVNTEKFEVLRRTDNTAFEVVNVQASKNTGGVHDYNFVDQSPLAGKSYYQLKQYDKDGKFTVSDVKLVTIATLTAAFEAYPNPTDGWVTVKHEVLATDSEVVVADLQGRKQFSQKVKKGEGSTKINLSSLSSGMYIVTLTNEGKKQTLKVIKK
ncbi:MAG: T9SS type A sorting domain-containing protein, partial [Chitinophagaceae bacterium]